MSCLLQLLQEGQYIWVVSDWGSAAPSSHPVHTERAQGLHVVDKRIEQKREMLHIHIYIHVYIHAYAYIYICIYRYTYIYIYTPTYTYVPCSANVLDRVAWWYWRFRFQDPIQQICLYELLSISPLNPKQTIYPYLWPDIGPFGTPRPSSGWTCCPYCCPK